MSGSPTSSIASALRTRVVRAGWHVGVVGALATMLASLAMQPLIDGGWWLPRTFLTVLAVVGMGGLVRTLGLPAPLQPVLQAGTLLIMLTVLFAREEAVWRFLPGPAALARLQELVGQGRSYAEATVPPAGADAGLLLIVVAGVGLVALAVDTLAAGLDLPGLTLIPLGALFVVPWLINRGYAPGWAFGVVAVGWLGLLSATQRGRAQQWSPEARPGAAGTGAVVAAVTTALALLAGGITTASGSIGPLTGIGGPGGAVELDALVSLRRSLVSQDDRVVLTMTTSATRPDYLRLAVLEQFDGTTWLPADSTTLDSEPPPGPAQGAAGAGSGPLAEYRMDVGPLTGSTLPSPAGTIASLNDWPVAWDQRTSLPERTDGGTIEGTRIALVAAPATWDASGLRSASLTPTTRDQVLAENGADPTPVVGDELADLAREVVAGAGTPYDAAVALQDWFRSTGGFTYSTAVQAGSSQDALTAFLTDRIGYCEQFSATMALMARALGIPARVVVGFTQGRREGTTWVVRGTDAHAWPELWMGTAGWVRFEPTPGAPTTSTPRYTRTQAPDSPSEAPSDQADTAGDQATDTPGRVPEFEDLTVPAGGSGPVGSGLGRVLLALLGIALVLPGALRWVRRRRRLHAGDGEAAYREVSDTLADLLLGAQEATPRATLRSVGTLIGQLPGGKGGAEALDAVGRIQRAVEWQRYGAPEPAPRRAAPGRAAAAGPATAVVERTAAPVPRRPGSLAHDVRIVRRALGRRAGWPRRALGAVAPRSALGISRAGDAGRPVE
jgi:transglutaminase-like putative cysteine protease